MKIYIIVYAMACAGLIGGGVWYRINIVMPQEEALKQEEAQRRFFNHVPQKDKGNKGVVLE